MMLGCIRQVIFSRDRNIIAIAQGIARLIPEHPCSSASRKDKFPRHREKIFGYRDKQAPADEDLLEEFGLSWPDRG